MKRYNGKVRFLEGDINFKAGKIYEIKDGKICNDDGESFPVFEEFWSFEDVKRYFSSDEGTYSKNGLLVERYTTKQKEKIYISGPISGTEDYKERFEKAEKELKAQGYRVINPAKVNANLPEDTTWEEYMRISLCMLSMCDGICMLEGWQQSRGANLEYAYAKGMGITVYEFGLKLMKYLENASADYDVDKVLERLKQKAIPVVDDDEHIVSESNVREPYEIKMVALSDAIEIVKDGGKNDN